MEIEWVSRSSEHHANICLLFGLPLINFEIVIISNNSCEAQSHLRKTKMLIHQHKYTHPSLFTVLIKYEFHYLRLIFRGIFNEFSKNSEIFAPFCIFFQIQFQGHLLLKIADF